MSAQKNLAEHAGIQDEFLNSELEPRLRQARAGKRQVYYVDAVHFVLGSHYGWVWAALAVYLKAAAGRQRYSVLGAWDAARNTLLTVTTEATVTAATVLELLATVARAGIGVPITLVLDNARYQHCAVVRARAADLGIELLFLPGYSPNLNLIERLWGFVKKRALRGRYHADFTTFKTAINHCLAQIPTTHRGALQTLMTHQFQSFANISLHAG